MKIPELKNGHVVLVKIKGQRNIMRRVFKWTEKRFGEITCYVFTAPVRRGVRVTWNAAESSLSISGPRVPASEVSVPHYDIEICERVISAPENQNTWQEVGA